MHTEVKAGDILDEKYRVERVLGTGGMGTVVAAHHLKLDQKVAIKFLHAEALTHEHIVKRFASEARAAAKIRSQHVARVIDVGEFENGAPFMVMEYLDGNDLSDELKKRGALPVEEAILYIIQACDALAEAHSAGIVHRDLKPANLFLTRAAGGAPITKVLDFGISKTTVEAAGGSGLTSTQMVMGTPHYMSPEQIRSTRDVDARSDIWALGVITFELLTDNLPFDGQNSTAIIAAIISELPKPVTEYNPKVPKELELVIARCLHRDKHQRFQNVAELVRALLPFTLPAAASLVSNISRIVGGAQETERPRPLGAADAASGPLDPNKTAVDSRVGAIAAASVQATEANFGTTQFKQKSSPGKALGWTALAAGILLLGGFATWRLSTPVSSTAVALPVPAVAAKPIPPPSGASIALPANVSAPVAVAPAPAVASVEPPVAAPAPVVAIRRKRASKQVERNAELAASAVQKKSESVSAEKAKTPVAAGGVLHMGLK